MKVKRPWPDTLEPEERIRLARVRTNRLVDHIRSLFLMDEANRLIAYSPILTSQIPRSYAGHAFAQFQNSMLLFEVVRLCAIWDPKGTDRANLPTITSLYNTPEILERIGQDTFQYHDAHMARAVVQDDDPELEEMVLEWHRNEARERAVREKKRTLEYLARVAFWVDCLSKSRTVQSIMGFRHQYIAHNLDLPVPDFQLEQGPPVPMMKYGDESRLLQVTVRLVDRLHIALNGASFAWSDAREQAQRSAGQLWENCHFTVPAR